MRAFEWWQTSYDTLHGNGKASSTLSAHNELLDDNHQLLTQNSPLGWHFMNIKWDKFPTWKSWLFKIKMTISEEEKKNYLKEFSSDI